MRAVSQYTNYGTQIRPQRSRALGDGGVEITQEPIYAQFTAVENGGFVYENEKFAAEQHFGFHGRTQHEDQATPSDVAYRLSVFDSEEAAEANGWDEETRRLVEETLKQRAFEAPQEVLIIETTPIPAPFPAYDEYDGDPGELVYTLIGQGHDLERVLHYERTWGKKRPHIIEALEIGVETTAAVNVSA